MVLLIHAPIAGVYFYPVTSLRYRSPHVGKAHLAAGGRDGAVQTVTDVIHEALAELFRREDGCPVLDHLAADLNTVRTIIERMEEQQTKTLVGLCEEVSDLRNQISELAQRVEQLTTIVEAKRTEHPQQQSGASGQ
ncbi:hypothetical protein JL100_029955 (plasmid) [Skermanella mucosa]|uniref:hypothetical protein n=1 Tax=Skermanella mucosa TaxID=1789672 RepID=UPI00192B0AFD|nr:hypothetical protein [Skermanella mucosa]UEM24466.1 hypothetical protein JL100_029955 [Skermanella mucosa]